MTRVYRLSCSASPTWGMSVIWDRRNREKGIASPLQSTRLPSKGMQSPSSYHPVPSPCFLERAPALPTECEKQLSPGCPPGHHPSGRWECLLFWTDPATCRLETVAGTVRAVLRRMPQTWGPYISAIGSQSIDLKHSGDIRHYPTSTFSTRFAGGVFSTGGGLK